MGRKLIDMSELEYGVVSTVVVTAVVHYTRLARVARGRNLLIFVLTMGFCCFTSLLCMKFYLRHGILIFYISTLCCFIFIYHSHYLEDSMTLG